jgi:hypothetical protein
MYGDSVTYKINLLMLEIITVYSENHMEPQMQSVKKADFMNSRYLDFSIGRNRFHVVSEIWLISLSPASHGGDPCSNLCQILWNLW